MSMIFLKVLNMSIAAGWPILAVCVLRQVFRKAPKRLYPIFWAIVAVRLICPFAPESSFSLIPGIEAIRPVGVRSSQESIADNAPYFVQDIEEFFPDSGLRFIRNIGNAVSGRVLNSIRSTGDAVTGGMLDSIRNTGDAVTGGMLDSIRNTGDAATGGMLDSMSNTGDAATGGVSAAARNNIQPAVSSTMNSGSAENMSLIASVSVNPMYFWLVVGSTIWLIGFIVMLSHAFYSYLRLKGRVREAIWLRDNIWLCDAVKSPFVLGIVRPRIYLPSGLGLTPGLDESMESILSHERAHLKRLDHLWKLLGYLLLAVYWFHPLIWAAYILFCRDIEFACDERVIRNMDLEGKKTYADVLLKCSMQKKMSVSYPLAFGEVSIKARVGAVLNYRRPTFWTIIAAIAVCVVLAVCFLTNPESDAFDIKIVIPANSIETVHYSEEEISPYRDRVTLFSGEGLGDTEVVLKPTGGCTKEDVYEPVYMTHGFPVEMYAEKGGWFKIGVAIGNPTDEDIVVYVRAEGVEVRIADSAGAGLGLEIDGGSISSNRFGAAGEAGTEPSSGTPSVSDTKEPLPGTLATSGIKVSLPKTESPTYLREDAVAAIYAAILDENASSYPEHYDFACCDFVPLGAMSGTPLAGETTHIITYYGWILDQKYNISESGIETVGGSHIPAALTFALDENGYQLKEFWRPRDGSYFVEDIRDKFPSDIADDGIDSQKYGIQQIQSCYRQAVEFSGLNTAAVIENLLDTICSEPKASSNPQDYINAHSIEYRELIYYGEYTLRYCFGRFGQGNETGLEGKIMAMVCEELLQSQNDLPITAGTAETGQSWYDALAAQAGGKGDPNP